MFLLTATLLAAFGLLALAATRAEAVPLAGSANPLPGSTFEGGDGDQTATLPRTDWQNAQAINHSPDPNANDSIFGGGNQGKENNPGGWAFDTITGGSTPGKNNILDAWSQTDPLSQSVFLNLAFTRSDDTGTTYMAFELNQRADMWVNSTGATIPCRTTGDVIVSYQVSGNSPDVILQKWTTDPGATDAATGCAKTGKLTDFTAFTDNVDAQGAVNGAPITNFLPVGIAWPNNTIPAKLFGEASLNLTTLLQGALGTPCFSFGSIWMHTRASTSDTSNLDDYVAPRPLLVRNCSASGVKFHDLNANGVKDAGEPGLAGFRIWADYDQDGLRDTGVEAEPFADTDANGNYTITNLRDPSGTYNLREQLPGGGTGGWICSAPATTASGGDFPCAHTNINGATTPNATGKDFGNYKPPTIRVEKDLVPADDTGRFDLKVDATTVKTAAGDEDGATQTVSIGTHSVSEAGNGTTDLTKYTSTISCTKNGSAYLTGNGTSLGSIQVQSGDAVVCRIQNTRKQASITVRKQLVPETDDGRFDLKVGATVVKAAAGDNDSGTTNVAPGAYSVSETGTNGTDLGKYDSSWACTKNNVAYLTGSGTSLASVAVDSNDVVVCEVTNVRRKAGITVVKQLVPENDPGRFDLKVGATVVKAAAGDDQSGSLQVDPGSYTVSEAGANGTDLTKYDSSVACVKNGQAYKSGNGTSLGGIDVDSNDAVTCTVTNTRRKANILVRKQLVPESDPGRFDLKVGATVVKAAAGDNEGGDLDVAPGTYGASETGAGTTDLAKYDSSWACTKNDVTVASGTGTSIGGLTVDSNDQVVCEVTNVRRKAGITVVKQLVPEDDPGRFDLKVDGKVVKTAAGDDQGGTAQVDPGSHSVAETGANGTDLAKYDSDVACLKNGQAYKSGTGTSLAGIEVDSNDAVTCTITNSRRPANISVVKQLVPENDPGRFDLSVGQTVVKAAAGDNEGGDLDVAPGTYGVSEAAANTDLAKYDSSWACTKNGQAYKTGSGASLAGIAVDSNDDVVCEVTNVRRQAGITVVKQLVPEDDAGRFDLKVDSTVVKQAAGDNDSGHADVAPGSYTVSETGANGTSLAKYDSAVACLKNGQAYKSDTGTSLAGIDVDSNDAVTCTVTNARRPGNIEVVKQLVPESDPGTFALSVDGTVVNPSAGDGEGGDLDVAPGTHSASEDGADETDLATYDAAWACTKNEQSYKTGTGTAIAGLDVDSNDQVRCEVTNTKRAHARILKTEAGATPDGTWSFVLTGGPDDVDLSGTTDSEGKLDFGYLKPGDYTLCETGIPSAWHSSLERAPYNGTRQADGAGKVKVCVAITLTAGQSEPIAVDNTRPGTLVIKEGNLLVHHGDTITYTFDVSNNGNAPLKNVSVEDDRCDTAPVRDAAHDANADGDALLEPAGTPDATKSEVWRFTCTKVVSPDHASAEENPIVNVATAHAFDEAGNEVTDKDDHSTTIIHPGIEVTKTPDVQRVHVGDTITYTFEVTNNGDTPLAVKLSDPKCDSTPSGPAGDADNDGKLDVSETWIYTCSHVVDEADGDPVHNEVTVTGTDVLGGPKGTVTDKDQADVDVLHPGIDVEKQPDVTKAHVGDAVTYTFTVTNAGDTPLAVQLSDPKCDDDTLSGPAGDADSDGKLDLQETWTYTCTHVVKDSDGNPLHNVVTVTGTDAIGGPKGSVTDTDEADVEVLKPGTLVVKEGNVFAYPGDTVTYTFAVTNNGNTPLSDVHVTDDKCSPVSATPTQKMNDDGDAALDPVGADGQTPEKWIFSCTTTVPANHQIGDTNPIHNIAAATGKDTLGKTVTATDDHDLVVLHPAVHIEKTGPATATVGDVLNYTLTITNPGDVAFAAQEVGVTDPRCSQPPVLQGKGADKTPNQFDPGDTWTYTCSAETAGQAPGTFVNTATVTAKDVNGRTVTDTDDFPTQLNAQQVIPEEVVHGTARLAGPSGCVRNTFNATVRGSRIAHVTFFLDGKRVKRISAKAGQTVFRVKLDPRTVSRGVHRVTAKVVFVTDSQTKSKTLRLSFQRCRKQVVRPRFTG